MQEDEEENDSGHDFFELIEDIDNLSFDVSVSKETSVSAIRSVKGATLPALLRRLTSIETSTQVQILTLLLNMKAIECTPFELIQFLHKRFFLTQKMIDTYAMSVRSEVVCERSSSINNSTLRPPQGSAVDQPPSSHWLLQDRAVIGSQYYWHCSLEELNQHNGDRIAAKVLHLLRHHNQQPQRSTRMQSASDTWRDACESQLQFQDDIDDDLPLSENGLELESDKESESDVMETLTALSRDDQQDHDHIVRVSSLVSVQVGVLLFLETWLNFVPEDFMLCITTCSSSTLSHTDRDSRLFSEISAEEVTESLRAGAGASDVLDFLIHFLRGIAGHPSVHLLGLAGRGTQACPRSGGEHQTQQEPRATSSTAFAEKSLLRQHFPCVCKLLQLTLDSSSHEKREEGSEEDCNIKKVNEVDVNLAGDSLNFDDKRLSVSSRGDDSASYTSSTDHDTVDVIMKPLALQRRVVSFNSKADRNYYQCQLERVLTGEINDSETLTSLRDSFYDRFGDDSLSEILEFERSMSQVSVQDNRNLSWRFPVERVDEAAKYVSTTTAETVLSLTERTTSLEELEEAGTLCRPPANNDGFERFSFFKSLFRSKPVPAAKRDLPLRMKKVPSFTDEEITGEIGDDTKVNEIENLAQGLHIVSLPSKLKVLPSSDKATLLLIPQDSVPSALSAASMGIRMATALRASSSSSDTPPNRPYEAHNQLSGGTSLLRGGKVVLKSSKNIMKNATSDILRKQFVSALAQMNEDNFCSCVEVYSHFGLILSAVELRTAQDYVASSDPSAEVPSRLFVDPIDRYIIRYRSTDALCSEKISYLVKSSREEVLQTDAKQRITSPTVDKERSLISRDSYMYDADYNNSSSAVDQQQKRNKHQKENRRRTMGTYLQHQMPSYGSRRRQTSFLIEPARRSGVGGGSSSLRSSERGGVRTSRSSSFSTIPPGADSSSRTSDVSLRPSSALSMSESLFGSSHAYLGPSIFLDFRVEEVAANLTMRLHYMFCTIPLLEFFVDFAYSYDAKSNSQNRTPMLTRFRKESEKLQTLFIGEVLVHPDVSTRAEVVIKMIKVAEKLARIRSHHALMLIVYALHTHAIYRLKSTWAVVHAKLPGRWDLLTELVGIGGNKLVSFFCERQSKSGISDDIRKDMFIYVNVAPPPSEEEEGREERNVGIKSSPIKIVRNGSNEDGLSYSPKRPVHAYSSDSSSYGKISDSYNSNGSYHEFIPDKQKERFVGSYQSSISEQEEWKDDEDTLPSAALTLSEDNKKSAPSVTLEIPIMMKRVNSSGCGGRDDSEWVQLGFHYMSSSQNKPLPFVAHTAPHKCFSSTKSIVEIARKSFANNSTVKQKTKPVEVSSENSSFSVKRADSIRWRVENTTFRSVAGSDDDEEDSEVPGAVNMHHFTTEDKIGSRGHTIATDNANDKLQDSVTSSSAGSHDVTASSLHPTNVVSVLVALAEENIRQDSKDSITEATSSNIESEDRRQFFSYRHLVVNNLSLNPPQSGLGEVRSDGLTGSNALTGVPIASQKPFMPFLNGILQKIIRLNELPNFLRAQPQPNMGAAAPEKEKHEINEKGFLWVDSPGNSSTDPKLMLINFGKLRSISNLIMLIRSSQLTPFSLHVDFALQKMLYHDAMYKTEDSIWDRSSELE